MSVRRRLADVPAGFTRLTTLRLICSFRAVDGTTGDERVVEGPENASTDIVVS